MTESHPLRVVLYNEFPQKTPEFQAWMADMEMRFRLRGLESYTVSSLEPKKGPTWDSLYQIYEFVPRVASAVGAAPGAAVRR